MAQSYETYVSNGSQTIYTFGFDYIQQAFVEVLVDGNPVGFTLSGTYQVTLDAAAPVDAVIIIRRNTSTDSLVTFTDGSILVANDLNLSALQALHVAGEALDRADGSLLINEAGSFTTGFRTITDLGDPVNPLDAVNLQFVQADTTSSVAQAQAASSAASGSSTSAATSASTATAASIAAIDARDDAVVAQLAAEAAELGAVGARDAALTARNEARDARDDAETAATSAANSVVLAEAALALSGNSRAYPSRANLVSAVAGAAPGTWLDGDTFRVEDVLWVYETGATTISDLPGLVPVGEMIFSEHFPNDAEAEAYSQGTNRARRVIRTKDGLTSYNQYFTGTASGDGFNLSNNEAALGITSHVTNSRKKQDGFPDGNHFQQAIATHMIVSDDDAQGDYVALRGTGVLNVSAPDGTRLDVVGVWGNATIRDFTPPYNGMGEVWGGYLAGQFSQDNGLILAPYGGNWVRGSNNSVPLTGQFTVDNASNPSWVRIHKTDNAGVPRGADFSLLGIGCVLRFEAGGGNYFDFLVQAPYTNEGAYIEVEVKDRSATAAPSLDSVCALTGTDVFDPSVGVDGKLVGVEIGCKNWGGVGQDDPDASAPRNQKYGIWFAQGGSSDNSIINLQPSTAMIKNGGADTNGGWYYGYMMSGVRKSYITMESPRQANVVGLDIAGSAGVTGTWADGVIRVPSGTGIAVYDAGETGLAGSFTEALLFKPAWTEFSNSLKIAKATAKATIFLAAERTAETGTFSDLQFSARNASASFVDYAQINVNAVDITAGAETGAVVVRARVGGSTSEQLKVSDGVTVGAPTGSYKGFGTINVGGLFIDGASAKMPLIADADGTAAGNAVTINALLAALKAANLMET